ncbi:hypothetical protein [Leifsonia sp. NPDC077715]|uniref:hypothetical protein n=1 Tax=Leifsonia sp. NPDC077715 TaxID=3155539 RepID=UPI0034378654
MGVLEIGGYGFPVDDFTLAHVHAVLQNALPEFPHLDVSLFFSEDDRVEFRVSDESEFTVSVREPQALCDQCLAGLVSEVLVTGGIRIVSGLRASARPASDLS